MYWSYNFRSICAGFLVFCKEWLKFRNPVTLKLLFSLIFVFLTEFSLDLS